MATPNGRSRNPSGSRRGYNRARGGHRTPSNDRTPTSNVESQTVSPSKYMYTRGSDRGYRHGNRRARGRRGHSSVHHDADSRRENPLHIYRLDIQEIIQLSKQRPDEIVMILDNKLKGFQQSLSSCQSIKGNIRQKYVEVVIEILKKVCLSDLCEIANTILAEFLSVRCAQFHGLLSEFIKMLPSFPDTLQITKDICYVFANIMFRLRVTSWNVLPIDDLHEAVNKMAISPGILLEVQALKDNRNEICEEVRKKNQPKQVDEASEWDDSHYRTIPILPTIEEVCSATPPRLRPSIICGSYTSWEHYYDIQFRLLREDFIAPLRRGIDEVKSRVKGRRLTDVYIYKNVQLIEPLFTYEGVCYLMQFDTSKFRQRKSWEHSKRLIFGSLLCFSPISDNFEEEVYFATVVNRDPQKLANGQVEVQFLDSLEVLSHMCITSFTVVESKAYFEASRHILHSLKTAEVDTMPFSKYLISNNSLEVQRPAYVNDDTALFDIRWLYPSSHDMHTASTINILNDQEWPSESVIELDESQLKAIKMALTQEISVIQGPPGTGKTYIGYKIVQTLLQNRDVWDPNHTSPILVMCLTNHALDQFLEGILHNKLSKKVTQPRRRQTCDYKAPEIVRVGSRSQSQEMQEFYLKNVRKRIVPHHMLHQLHEIQDKLKDIGSHIKMESIESQLIIQSLHSSNMVTTGLVKLKGVIDPKHYYDLVQIGTQEELRSHSLEIWLGLWDRIEDTEALTSTISIDDATKVLELNAENDNLDISHDIDGQNKSLSDLSNDDAESHSGESTTEELIDIQGEAEIEESSRKVDDDAFRHIDIKQEQEEEIHSDALTMHVSQASTSDQSSVAETKTVSRKYKYQRKTEDEIRKILNNGNKIPVMDEEELDTIISISELPLNKRWALFKLWIKMYQELLIKSIQENTNIFDQMCEKYRECQQNLDRYALENAQVIGMTTTGAAKYQHILHLVKPKIVIVEEAAEVLESHIVSALNAGTQHLILIGDHKQLRPKLNEYDLAKKHHLDISLFERLIRNGMPHATLLIQHRMRPQIARLVCPHVYNKLVNHDSVETYGNVKGFDKNLFFFQHYAEEKEDPLILSHSNEYEAQFVVALCKHLLNQGYEPSQITILTAYTGQLLKVRQKMPKKDFAGVKVTNVDNFQGEENDIIILSLVRNNSLGNVGFLKEENRVCVALSRAKAGLYCFGNFEMLRKNVPLWEAILSDVEREKCVGTTLQIHCQNHPNKKFLIEKPEDFAVSMPKGGCNEPCMFRLECGHQCSFTCHILDSSHTNFVCKKPCRKLCSADLHRCKALCFKSCPPCKELVMKDMPNCGHKQEIKCCDNPALCKCHTPCLKLCSNGLHECPFQCFQCFTGGCSPCRFPVNKEMPHCGHKQTMHCFRNPNEELCHNLCNKVCPEGHPCQKQCHEPCGDCLIDVERVMPDCGHKQKMKCFVKPSEHKCRRKCNRIYDCGHFCPKKCHEPCDVNCSVQVAKVLPHCKHIATMECYRSAILFHCTEPCKKLLSCGHLCKQECGSVCDVLKCMEIVQRKLPCNHTAMMPCRNKWSDHICREICRKRLPCGHECRNECTEPCVKVCCIPVKTMCAKGSHKIKVPCHERNYETSKNPCTSKCSQQLSCGHYCQRKCFEECECTEMVKKACRCGHTHSVKCGDAIFECTCQAECGFLLNCGHKCSGKCGDCFTSRIHSPCIYEVQVKRFCGHESRLPCLGLEDRCPKKCQLARCIHSNEQCDHTCWEVCDVSCSRECFSQCPHVKCKRICSEICDVSPCGKPCTTLKSCKHYCPGLCGENCITTACVTCSRKKFIEKGGLSKKKQFKPQDHQYIQLECSHFFTVDMLDNKLGFQSTDSTQLIFPPLCPTCRTPVANTLRYRRLWLRKQKDILEIKSRLAHISDSVYGVSREIRAQCGKILRSYKSELLKSRLGSMNPKQFNKIFESLSLVEHEILSQETVCCYKLLIAASNLQEAVHHDLVPTVEKFVFAIARILVAGRGKLSKQIEVDIHSELYRISLLALVYRVGRIADIQESKRVGAITNCLEQMDKDNNYRMTYEKYQECLYYLHDMIQRLDCQSLIMKPVTLPPETKGEWYKCAVGHIYFVEAHYSTSKKAPICPDCTSKVSGSDMRVVNPSSLPNTESVETTEDSNCTLM